MAKVAVGVAETSAVSCDADTHHEFFDWAKHRGLIDRSAFREHNYVYVTPAEVGQARRVKATRRVEAN